ncbi:response regulator [Thermosulfurimonas sp.]|uniref:response regulator n=1 Tax=Thermosulfurimonas sp. TaxID=2080236 RepID=UPI0025D680F5|nr:response regulator [Thermosulfurimonas sp.]
MPKPPTVYMCLSESVAQRVRDTLAGFRLNLVAVPDGETLIELSRRHPPDLIILEKEIPKLDGYAVVLLLKTDPKTSRVPVVGICKCFTDAEAEKARDAGCDDYVCYPLNEEEFKDMVQRYLTR